MGYLFIKLKEVATSVIPITLLAVLLHFSLVPLPGDLLWRFLICAIIIILGLAIFLTGADLGVQLMGKLMGEMVGKSKRASSVGFIGFLLGFLITIAEPDLIILGQQIENASAGAVNATLFVLFVSAGVGLTVALGLYRILLNASYRVMMAACYMLVLFLAIAISPEFLAFSFDASGATTGAMTTPFILAVGVGISQLRQGRSADEDSFGMVGMMSVGPILAVMLMAIFLGFGSLDAPSQEAELSSGVVGPILALFPHTTLECLMAIAPISALFFVANLLRIKANRYDLLQIIRGLLYAFVGLILFLVAVSAGFLETGQYVGKALALIDYSFLLPAVGLVLGLVVVLAEPAVYVLCTQVQDVTAGHISRKILLIALSLGVGLAVCLSMLRIIIEPLHLWHILLPGFMIAVALSFYVPPLFVGIAYDAGGVASGPMTATFILALTQGAAFNTETANILADGFGVIATVAMTPIIAILTLGAIYKLKTQKMARNKGVEA
ncbi:MAG: DUF1538 domain-containing protein [Bradymonadales bacterium]